MDNDDIMEDQPLLMPTGQGANFQAKKTYSLNTGLAAPIGNIAYSGDLDAAA